MFSLSYNNNLINNKHFSSQMFFHNQYVQSPQPLIPMRLLIRQMNALIRKCFCVVHVYLKTQAEVGQAALTTAHRRCEQKQQKAAELPALPENLYIWRRRHHVFPHATCPSNVQKNVSTQTTSWQKQVAPSAFTDSRGGDIKHGSYP